MRDGHDAKQNARDVRCAACAAALGPSAVFTALALSARGLETSSPVLGPGLRFTVSRRLPVNALPITTAKRTNPCNRNGLLLTDLRVPPFATAPPCGSRRLPSGMMSLALGTAFLKYAHVLAP